MTPEQLEAMTVTELKAILCDCLQERDRTLQNIAILNQIIARKLQVKPETVNG